MLPQLLPQFCAFVKEKLSPFKEIGPFDEKAPATH
jgi:hypothetical protein